MNKARPLAGGSCDAGRRGQAQAVINGLYDRQCPGSILHGGHAGRPIYYTDAKGQLIGAHGKRMGFAASARGDFGAPGFRD